MVECSNTQQALLYNGSQQPKHRVGAAANGLGVLYRQAALHSNQPALHNTRLLVTGVTAWTTGKGPLGTAADSRARRAKKQQSSSTSTSNSSRSSSSSSGRGFDAVEEVSLQQLEEAGYGEVQQLLAPLVGKSAAELEACLPQVLPRLAPLLADGTVGFLFLPALMGVKDYEQVSSPMWQQLIGEAVLDGRNAANPGMKRQNCGRMTQCHMHAAHLCACQHTLQFFWQRGCVAGVPEHVLACLAQRRM